MDRRGVQGRLDAGAYRGGLKFTAVRVGRRGRALVCPTSAADPGPRTGLAAVGRGPGGFAPAHWSVQCAHPVAKCALVCPLSAVARARALVCPVRSPFHGAPSVAKCALVCPLSPALSPNPRHLPACPLNPEPRTPNPDPRTPNPSLNPEPSPSPPEPRTLLPPPKPVRLPPPFGRSENVRVDVFPAAIA
jgi:hypothetical protein